MSRYLNSDVKFKCSYGGKFWPLDIMLLATMKQIGKKTALTARTFLIMDMETLGTLCKAPTAPKTPAGTPIMPCICIAVLTQTWEDTSKNLKLNGAAALIDGSSIHCPFFHGKITQVKSPEHNVKDDPETAEVKIAPIGAISSTSILAGVAVASVGEMNGSAVATDSNGLNGCEPSKEEAVAPRELTEEDTKDALCDHKSCDRRNDCEYLRASSSLIEGKRGDSAVLASNMQEANGTDYLDECNDIKQKLYFDPGISFNGIDKHELSCSVAHHHLIPAEQCYSRNHEKLVKLGIFCGFDINEAINGICLPTPSYGIGGDMYGFRSLSDFEKESIAYRAMAATGRQWHSGGHEYEIDSINKELESLSKEEKIRFKNPEVYAKLVNQKLTERSKEIDDEFGDACMEDEKEEIERYFRKMINELAEEIKEGILAFKDYYVSKMAIRYIFQEHLEPANADTQEKIKNELTENIFNKMISSCDIRDEDRVKIEKNISDTSRILSAQINAIEKNTGVNGLMETVLREFRNDHSIGSKGDV